MPTSSSSRRFARAARSLVLAAATVIGFQAVPAAGADSVPVPAPQADRWQLAPDIRARIERMRQTSPTFRQQYERLIEAPLLLMRARIDPGLVQRSYRARTTLVRYSSGLIVASVEIGPGGHQAEWIAHEFEHILEQLEGMDLPALATQRRPGVWYSGESMIETSRAMRAGRAVFDEMRRGDSRSDNLVQ